MFKSPIGRLRLVGMLEAVSYILLLGVAMPLKYLAGKPETRAFGEEMVSIVGMAHGILFVSFGLVLLQVMNAHDWSIKKALKPFIATLIPFGPFVIDKQLKQEQAEVGAGS
ncbi:MAG: integral membrane protein [Pseudoalteromonas tetraodonis]|jgi:integral membrane protein